MALANSYQPVQDEDGLVFLIEAEEAAELADEGEYAEDEEEGAPIDQLLEDDEFDEERSLVINNELARLEEYKGSKLNGAEKTAALAALDTIADVDLVEKMGDEIRERKSDTDSRREAMVEALNDAIESGAEEWDPERKGLLRPPTTHEERMAESVEDRQARMLHAAETVTGGARSERTGEPRGDPARARLLRVCDGVQAAGLAGIGGGYRTKDISQHPPKMGDRNLPRGLRTGSSRDTPEVGAEVADELIAAARETRKSKAKRARS